MITGKNGKSKFLFKEKIKTIKYLKLVETNKVKKKRYLMRQDNINIFNKTIFLRYRTRQIKATKINK